jgi:hypothetical protein
LTAGSSWPGPGFPRSRRKLTLIGRAIAPKVSFLARPRTQHWRQLPVVRELSSRRWLRPVSWWSRRRLSARAKRGDLSPSMQAMTRSAPPQAEQVSMWPVRRCSGPSVNRSKPGVGGSCHWPAELELPPHPVSSRRLRCSVSTVAVGRLHHFDPAANSHSDSSSCLAG